MQAGFCSLCGRNVYLTDDGGCVSGHDKSCVKSTYEVPDIDLSSYGTAEQPFSASPLPVPTAEATAGPSGRNLFLVVAAGIAVLALVLGVGGVLLAGSLTPEQRGIPVEEALPDLAGKPSQLKPKPVGKPITAPKPQKEKRIAIDPDKPLTRAEKAYQLALAKQGIDLSQALLELGKLSLDPRPKSDEWIDGVRDERDAIRQILRQAESMRVPARFSPVHKEYLAGIRDLDWVMQRLTKATITQNPSYAVGCDARLRKAQDHLNRAARMLRDAIPSEERGGASILG